MAHAWIDVCSDIIDDNFHSRGTGTSDGYKGLLKESQSSWKFYASGIV